MKTGFLTSTIEIEMVFWYNRPLLYTIDFKETHYD